MSWSIYTRLINSRESRKVGKALRVSGYDISNDAIVNRTAQAVAEYFFPPLRADNDPNFERRSQVLQTVCEVAGWLPPSISPETRSDTSPA